MNFKTWFGIKCLQYYDTLFILYKYLTFLLTGKIIIGKKTAIPLIDYKLSYGIKSYLFTFLIYLSTIESLMNGYIKTDSEIGSVEIDGKIFTTYTFINKKLHFKQFENEILINCENYPDGYIEI